MHLKINKILSVLLDFACDNEELNLKRILIIEATKNFIW